MGIFLRHLQMNRHHRAGMDTGHAADTAFAVPNALLSLQMKTLFRTDLCADSAADAFICNLIKVMSCTGTRLGMGNMRLPVR